MFELEYFEDLLHFFHILAAAETQCCLLVYHIKSPKF